MPKNLTIVYGDTVLWDDIVDEFQYSESDAGVAVAGKVNAEPAVKAKSGGGLLDLLTAARKAQTQTVVERKRSDLMAEAAADDLTFDIAEPEPEGRNLD